MATSAPASRMAQIDAWIEQLADQSSSKRDAAATQLAMTGQRPESSKLVRDALTAAADSPIVQRRTIARAILAKIPLSVPDDSPTVREVLRAYQRASPEGRPVVAAKLLALNTPETDAAFARVLTAERDGSVLWAIVARVPDADRDRLRHGALAAIDPSGDRSAPLAPAMRYLLVARPADVSGSPADDAALAKQYQQILDGMSNVPDAAVPALSQIAELLCRSARAANDADREIAVRRQVALITPQPDATTAKRHIDLSDLERVAFRGNGVDIDAADLVIAPPTAPALGNAAERYLMTRLRLHSAAGVREDLASMGVDAEQPLVQLILTLLDHPELSRVATLGPELLPWVDAVDDDALIRLLPMLGAYADQWPTADALAMRTIARLDKELAAIAPNQPRRAAPLMVRRMRLGVVRLAAARAANDPAAIAEARRVANAIVIDPAGASDAWDVTFAQNASNVLAENFIDECRRAEREADSATRDAALDALARISLLSSNATLDAVYVLETHGRVAEADEVFAEELAQDNAALEANPDNYVSYNGIAWLCARTGRDLDRAYRLAARACEIAPGESSLMDTLAEAAFRTNRVADAVRLESAAHDLAKEQGEGENDPFMARQIVRFRAGLKSGDAERPLPSESWIGDY